MRIFRVPTRVPSADNANSGCAGNDVSPKFPGADHQRRTDLVADLVEDVDAIFGKEERGCDAVHRRVAPALVVETTLRIEVVEVGLVCLAAEEVHVCDLEIAPDCVYVRVRIRREPEGRVTDSGRGYRSLRHRRIRS
jgi:hypothetical protein